MRGRLLGLLVLALLLLGWSPVAVAPVAAATLLVDEDGRQCPSATFTTIQAAIAAAAVGDTITVCSGTYAEQLRFDPGKDGLTLRAQFAQDVMLTPPDALVNFDGLALITVHGARQITIEGLHLRGPIPIDLCVPTPLSGVLVEAGGAVTVRQTRITAIEATDPAVRAGHCSPGYGILVRAPTPEPRTTATLIANQVEQYLTSGIRVEGAGAAATMQQNQIRSSDSPAPSGRAGIAVGQGATAMIADNEIGSQGRAGPGLGEAPTVGIRLTAVSGVQVRDNRVTGSDQGIALTETTASTLRANQLQDYRTYGIALVDGAARNTLADNRLGPTTSPPAPSPMTGVTATIFPDAATPNSTPVGSLVAIDCLDATMGVGTAGTANQWLRNQGHTAIPAGLCEPN
jgi:parallel beta-helix repeat protein